MTTTTKPNKWQKTYKHHVVHGVMFHITRKNTKQGEGTLDCRAVFDFLRDVSTVLVNDNEDGGKAYSFFRKGGFIPGTKYWLEAFDLPNKDRVVTISVVHTERELTIPWCGEFDTKPSDTRVSEFAEWLKEHKCQLCYRKWEFVGCKW